jgi:Holliday junction resolvase-like predicted endonuclease
MTPLNKSVLETLHRRGTMEIRFLARTVLKSTPLRKSELDVIEELLREAFGGKSGITVIEYPTYRLKTSPKSLKLPTGKYARTALLALRESAGPMALPALVNHYNAKYKHSALCPEFWMWQTLEAKELSHIIASSGVLSIGLTDTTQNVLDVRRRKTPSSKVQGSIAERLDEKSLETVLANRPDLLESGLTVFQRQSRIPVGIIDLLCLDQKRNYVVVEIKRPAADYREIVGQITTYMGWVRKNIAAKGQTVRGIIVVGKQNERLEYSLELIPEISVRTFF